MKMKAEEAVMSKMTQINGESEAANETGWQPGSSGNMLKAAKTVGEESGSGGWRLTEMKMWHENISNNVC